MKKKIYLLITGNRYLLSFISKVIAFVGRNRKSIKGADNIYKFANAFITKSSIQIYGNNNRVEVNELSRLSNINMTIFGNNNNITISPKCVLLNLEIIVEDDNCSLYIGESSEIFGGHIALTEPNSKIEIGRYCLFSKDIEIRNGDSHSIFDCLTQERINYASDIVIGENVWIGAHARILKGSTIASNCVIANSSLTTKPFLETNCVIGGVPAKVIKRNIYWKRERTYKDISIKK